MRSRHSLNAAAGLIGRKMSSTNGSTVTLHVVSSLDGFIAKKDNSISWMDSPGDVYAGGVTEDDGAEVIQAIDCYVLGSRTYEHALQLGWPYGETPTVVVTRRELPSTRGSVEFYSGDLERLVGEILAPRYRNIWLVGGALLGQSFLRLGLVDEIRLMIAPVTLGDGLHLFGDSGTEQKWRLKNVVAYKNGFVELSYGRAPSAGS
jgi:dihydrofolate reductase